jgi:hypothetical protein
VLLVLTPGRQVASLLVPLPMLLSLVQLLLQVLLLQPGQVALLLHLLCLQEQLQALLWMVLLAPVSTAAAPWQAALSLALLLAALAGTAAQCGQKKQHRSGCRQLRAVCTQCVLSADTCLACQLAHKSITDVVWPSYGVQQLQPQQV